jgi:hypothetical protein
MSRPLVSIFIAAALSLGVSAHAQSSDSSQASPNVPAPVEPHVAADSSTSHVAPAVTPHATDSSVVPSTPPAATVDSAIPDPNTPARNDHGPAMANYPRHPMRPDQVPHQTPPASPPQANDTTPSPAVATAMVADLPFDEDSALEIKLKTDPEAARRYRSPRKAFFFSLLLPGAGQAYCGSWAKMTIFAAAEIGLGVGWYQVAIVASRDKANQAKRYAQANWSQGKYESNWKRVFTQDSSSLLRQGTAPWRESYCQSLYGNGNDASEARQACIDAPTGPNYSQHDRLFGASNSSSADSVFANIMQPETFYDMIGRYSEFVPGWLDAPDTASPDGLRNYYNARVNNSLDPTKPIPVNPWGYSQMQANYRALRTRSDDLARTQKWFLGGMVLNHLVSALDAALQASRMNRTLLHLETTTSWMDHIDIDGGFVMVPQLKSTASLAWRF